MALHMGRTQKDLLEELIEQTHWATSEGSNDIKFPTDRGQGSWLQGDSAEGRAHMLVTELGYNQGADIGHRKINI